VPLATNNNVQIIHIPNFGTILIILFFLEQRTIGMTTDELLYCDDCCDKGKTPEQSIITLYFSLSINTSIKKLSGTLVYKPIQSFIDSSRK